MVEGILNRLRGTGVLKYFGTLRVGNKEVGIKLVWNHVYGLYLACIVGYLAGIWAGLAVLVAYLIGEASGWGEWVGALTRYEHKNELWLRQQYEDKEGKGFPFIHYIANYFTRERIQGTFEERLSQYMKYSSLALALRGFYWWFLVYFTMYLFAVIGLTEALLASVILGVAFPLACTVGKYWDFNKKFGIVSFSRGWENQEVVYGLIQGLVFWSVILMR